MTTMPRPCVGSCAGEAIGYREHLAADRLEIDKHERSPPRAIHSRASPMSEGRPLIVAWIDTP